MFASVLALAAASPAMAVDFSLSGFGTLGYARSNESFTYQRFIDDGGTVKRDSVAGLQVDAKLNNQFGATLQIKAAEATDNDHRIQASVSWAFASWRPTNDLLIRAGKQRIPLYLFSETVDVGATYDFARLPTEMYSLAPSNDYIGLSLSKSMRLGNGELVFDGYVGKSKNDFRVYLRDTVPGIQQSGATFEKLEFRGGGLVATYKINDDTFRIGALRAVIRQRDRAPFPSSFPFVSIAPGIGYYQVDESIPEPGLPMTASVTNTTAVIGAAIALPSNFQFIGEFARSLVPGSDLAPKGNRGYASLLLRTGKWTPYVTYAFLRSPQAQRDFFTQVNENTVPPVISGAALLNGSQRAGADRVFVYHQSSWALGTSYSFSATSKLKAEFLRSRIGDVSSLVDSPPRESVHDRKINVLSLSYSIVY